MLLEDTNAKIDCFSSFIPSMSDRNLCSSVKQQGKAFPLKSSPKSHEVHIKINLIKFNQVLIYRTGAPSTEISPSLGHFCLDTMGRNQHY